MRAAKANAPEWRGPVLWSDMVQSRSECKVYRTTLMLGHRHNGEAVLADEDGSSSRVGYPGAITSGVEKAKQDGEECRCVCVRDEK
jgi:hypothetical protein